MNRYLDMLANSTTWSVRQRTTLLRMLMLGCLIAVLTGCTHAQPTRPAAEPPRPTPDATAIPTPSAIAPVIDAHSWKVLYQRPGWEGGDTVDVRAVGDVMLGRYVAEVARARGFDYPFAQVGASGATPLLAADLTLGNLESPLTDRQTPLRPGPYRLPAPSAFAQPLRDAGFDALALANNHALDAGPQGLHDSATTLLAHGIQPLGVGASGDAAREPTYMDVDGMRIALLAFNAVADPEDQPDEGQDWGRAWLDDAAVEAVRQARDQADLVIVMLHWGQEYAAQPSEGQRAWARRLVAAGTDVIVGAHPHVLQPVEVLTVAGHTGLVAYSLGNFLFDQFDRPETSTGAVLRVLLDQQGVALAAAAPTDILAGQVHALPLETMEAQTALQALGAPVDHSITAHAAHPTLQAWRWDREAATSIAVPRRARAPAPPTTLLADLRGDGQPLWVTLDAQDVVTVRDGPTADAPVVWQNEEADWRVTRIAVGDPNNDGRIEVFLLLWRPDQAGILRSHPFLLGWRGGRYRIIWGGSATTVPMQDVAIGDLDGDGEQELVVLEGGTKPGDPGERVSIRRWQGWLFHQMWRSPAGQWSALGLQDLTADGTLEIVVNGP